MCNKHWSQARKGKRPYVLPSRIPLPRTATPEERFWIKVDKNGPTPTEHPELGPCWLWTSAVMNNGYGRFDKILAHHFLVGKPAEGHEWDHLCYVRHCIRPEHLEHVTRAENRARQRAHGLRANSKPACVNGHPFDEQNTGWLSTGRRFCKQCNREAQYRYRGGGPRTPPTHCKHGHVFNEENTYIRKNGNRACRACSREKMRAYRRATVPRADL